ncbi:sensor histidine kinase [Mycobacterium shimoidei]|uniref:sensor histidine kinase n=1 Tax=Mycobacterium shimoidei TaxID=29313 RepID=UPI003556E616
MTMFADPTDVDKPANSDTADFAAAKRPPTWSLRNWPVRWKVVAIVVVPLVLAMVFGGLRIYGALSDAKNLRLAADRAEVVPAISKYMSALDVALLAASNGGDVEGAKKNYKARKSELQARLADTDVADDVRVGVENLLNGGQGLLAKVSSNSIGLRDRVTSYAPILLTAENAIDGSVRVDNEKIRAAAQGLSRAIGARGQMMMQQLLATRGGDLPEPELRTSMITLAGTEPSTLFGMAEVLGVGSPEAKNLQQQMVTRMAIMSDPASRLVNNPALLRSIQTTDAIASQVIKDTSSAVTKAVEDRASDRRQEAIRDTVVVLAAIVAALVIVLLVARSLIEPLRVLRDGALKVAHEDLEREIARVRAGDERMPVPLPVYTTEEIGQVAHAVDELHTQALLLAGDETRLRLLVNDMFETMSRRNRSLVDQQLSLIDRLERNEDDPERLDSLFRLDHLAARMRRNGANLLVLAGAQLSRGDQRGPQPLATLINAATSEVEDYRRVEIMGVSDSTITGAATADVIHMLAELIDNALRYSPPTSAVHVSAQRRNDGGVHLEIVDAGLGMTDGDRRIANMRLRSGGEVTPDNARHMGLFVVGRLADRHGIRVRLRRTARDGRRSGTTAEVYLPPSLLVGFETDRATDGASRPAAPPAPAARRTPNVQEAIAAADYADSADSTVRPETQDRNGSHPVTQLPRRTPGSSGITGGAAAPSPWLNNESTPEPPAAQPVSAFFTQRAPVAPEPESMSATDSQQQDDDDWPADAAVPPDETAASDDLIYQRMLSEWLVDPHELARSPDLDWKSVWDHGWTAAAEVDNVPISAHTDQGLPVREPGARLVPGGAGPEATGDGGERDRTNGVAHHGTDSDNGVASNGGFQPGRHAAPARDPEAIRASISSHFGGVRAGRSHARENNRGSDQE